MTTVLDKKSEYLSDVAAFLETLYSPLSTVEVRQEVPLGPDNFSKTQTAQTKQQADNESPVTIFIAYAPADDEFRKRIEGDLKTLQRQKVPITWIAYDVTEAVELTTDIVNPLDAYELFLLLLSPDFVQLDYCYSTQMEQLVKKHQQGVWVSPILLRECLWEDTPFGKKKPPLPILPSSQPIAKWPDRDEAYKKIAIGVKRAVNYLRDHRG